MKIELLDKNFSWLKQQLPEETRSRLLKKLNLEDTAGSHHPFCQLLVLVYYEFKYWDRRRKVGDEIFFKNQANLKYWVLESLLDNVQTHCGSQMFEQYRMHRNKIKFEDLYRDLNHLLNLPADDNPSDDSFECIVESMVPPQRL